MIETIRIRGRSYFVLEKLSVRGAFRVFDPHAGPLGDYCALYRLPSDKVTRQRVEVLKRFGGPNGNRNFPAIVDYVRNRDELFVVLAWVSGTNLRDYFSAIRDGRTPAPSPRESVRLMRGMAHGLGHFHRKLNVVHGDISPANLIITQGTTQLMAVDFGSAWSVESTATKEVGDGVTSVYAAPERIVRDGVEDFRSDLFSMSVVAYEMLTMELPYDGLGGQAGLPALRKKALKTYTPPSHFASISKKLPRDSVRKLDELFRKSLALDVDDRYPTRTEWLKAWDELNASLQKGNRLSFFEQWVVGCFDYLADLRERIKNKS